MTDFESIVVNYDKTIFLMYEKGQILNYNSNTVDFKGLKEI